MRNSSQDDPWEIRRRLLILSPKITPYLEGASEEEIRALEEYAGAPLPAVYRQFLRHPGRSAGELFRGSEHALSQPCSLRLREAANRILERSHADFTLPERAFVFLMSQGYQFSYFHLDGDDDPEVHHYFEGDPGPRRLDNSLSEYLLRCVKACEQRAQRQQAGTS